MMTDQQTGMLDPQRRAMMAQALAGGSDQFAPIRQALAMRQMRPQQSQIVSPGTMANGGFTTSIEGGQGPGGLSRLREMAMAMMPGGMPAAGY